MMGSVRLLEDTPSALSLSLPMWGHSKEVVICDSENGASPETESGDTSIWNF